MVLTGDQKGTSYFLLTKRIVLGRGKEVDIPILDNKSSREHLELVKMDNTYVLTDLDSQNGTIVNDLKVTQKKLAENDNIVIGKTVLRFNIIQVIEKSKTIANPLEEVVEDNIISNPKSFNPKRIMITIIAFIGIFVVIFMDSSDNELLMKFKKDKEFSSLKESLSLNLEKTKKTENKEKEKEIGIIIHQGLRELREKNYYRAIILFDYALKINSEHYQAKYYHHLAKQTLKTEIEQLFTKAIRDRDSLKPLEAAKTYCSIIRLIDKNPSDERYISALKNINIIEEEMGLTKDELKCN